MCNNKTDFLYRYAQKREQIKRNKLWEEIKQKYETKQKEINEISKGLLEEYDKRINEIKLQKESFQSKVNEHKRNNYLIFTV